MQSQRAATQNLLEYIFSVPQRIDADEERRLKQKIAHGDQRAFQWLVRHYYWIPLHQAKRYAHHYGHFEDLFQEGIVGLFKTYSYYDWHSHSSFKSYSAQCVKSAILDSLRTHHILSFSKEAWSLQLRLPKILSTYACLYDRMDPTLEDIVSLLHSEDEKRQQRHKRPYTKKTYPVCAVKNNLEVYAPLRQPAEEDFCPDYVTSDNPLENLLHQERLQIVREAYRTLTSEEKILIYRKLHLDGHLKDPDPRRWGCRETTEQFGISHHTAGRRSARALHKLENLLCAYEAA